MANHTQPHRFQYQINDVAIWIFAFNSSDVGCTQTLNVIRCVHWIERDCEQMCDTNTCNCNVTFIGKLKCDKEKNNIDIVTTYPLHAI